MFKNLETTNLFLRSISHDDDLFIFELLSNDAFDNNYRNLKLKSEKDAVKFVNSFLETDSKIKHLYIVSLKTTNEKVGVIYLGSLDTLTSTIEISSYIRPSCIKKGYASEALEATLKFAKEELNMNVAYSLVNPNKLGAVRTVQKLGFYKTGEQRFLNFTHCPILHDLYYKPLYTRNSYQKEFYNEGADVSDNQTVIEAKEEFNKNPNKENRLNLVNALYTQFKHHDALSYIDEKEDNEELLYKKALICMKINRLNESNKILEHLFKSYKRIKYCYKLALTYYYLKDYKKAYSLLTEWYDLFDKDDERIAALFWIMACSIKLDYDSSLVKDLFFKYKGELKSGYYLAIKQYLYDNIEIDIDNMNDVHRSAIYYAASLFDEENRKLYLEKTLNCINPWGSSSFLAALYESK